MHQFISLIKNVQADENCRYRAIVDLFVAMIDVINSDMNYLDYWINSRTHARAHTHTKVCMDV